MNAETFNAPLRIESDHPALPGHFPGNPVVPGVLLLQHVATALAQWRGEKMTRLDVKFLAPLLPAQEAIIELRQDAARVRFTIRRRDDILARGTLECAP